jgi:oligopeptide/dipeptide ABC transporter ATP-binding protein
VELAMTQAQDAHPFGGPPAGTKLLEVKDLEVRFHQRATTVYAVNGVSFDLEEGKTLAIIGESGSGKTVTSRAMMALLPNTASVYGSVRLEGKELIGLTEKQMLQHRGPDLATVFQDPSRSLNPTMKVGKQIVEAIKLHLPLDKAAARKRAVELLGLVRLPNPEQRFDDYPHQLSGGMRQRVMIAIALACQPKILIADEATTALDVTTQAKIMDLLVDLQEQFHMALILISHNLGLAAQYTDEVAVMYAGKIVERAPTKELFENVRMPYTRVLLDAVPRLERSAHSSLPSITGGAPNLTSRPTGCAFMPRCMSATDRCREQTPPLEEDQPGHEVACWFPLNDHALDEVGT